VLDQVQTLIQPDDVWVADRNFCTLGFLGGIRNRGGSFVIRQHGQLQGELLGKRVCRGRTDTGTVYEQRVRFREDDGKGLEARRITVVLDKPTQDGDQELHLLTNLPAQKVSAPKVAEVYRQRWTIEGLFLEASQTLSCEINTLCYPKAELFAFCLGLVACNAVALLKGALRATHGAERVNMEGSAYYLALEIQQTHRGMMVALPSALWERFGTLTAKGMAEVLREMACHVRLERYRKTLRGPKKPPPKRSKYKNGEHVATFRVIADRKKRLPWKGWA
jgi:hypothetical protein